MPSDAEVMSTAANQKLAANTSPQPQSTVAREQQQHEHAAMQSSVNAGTRVNVLKTSGPHMPPSLPWGYLALYAYKPRKSDELELKKGKFWCSCFGNK